MQQPVLEDNGILVCDPAEVGNLLARNLSEVSRGLQTPEFLNHKRLLEASPFRFLDDDDGSDYNLPFTRSELDEALRHCSNIAAGDDGYHYSMLKHLPDITVQFLQSS